MSWPLSQQNAQLFKYLPLLSIVRYASFSLQNYIKIPFFPLPMIYIVQKLVQQVISSKFHLLKHVKALLEANLHKI